MVYIMPIGMNAMTDEEIKQMNRNTHELIRLAKVMQKAIDKSPHKILLVGGNPLGHSIPFDPQTKSGKVLRGLVDELGINAEYFDIWKNPEDEHQLYQDSDVLRTLIRYQKAGWIIVALGKKVQGAMNRYVEWSKDRYDYDRNLKYVSLPHPAARRVRDLQNLRKGLEKLVKKD